MDKELTLNLGDDLKIVTTHERAARAMARELAIAPGAGLIQRSVEPPQSLYAPCLAGIPAFGQLWPGQGGFNGGLYPGRDGQKDYYLIVSTLKNEPTLAYGGRGKKIAGADSRDDGATNTEVLLASGHEHPAAKFCADYRQDGHSDYFLGARDQMRFLCITVPELFQKGWYQTSTRDSSGDAWVQDFGDGSQDGSGLGYEYLVRPVRRFFVD